MKILKFNESLNNKDELYSLIDDLYKTDDLIDDDLIDLKDEGYKISSDENGNITISSDFENITDNIKLLKKLDGFKIDVREATFKKGLFKCIIDNHYKDKVKNKIFQFLIDNLYCNDDGDVISFSFGSDKSYTLIAFYKSFNRIYIDSSRDYYNLLVKNNLDIDYSKNPSKEEYLKIINLIYYLIDYAKENKININKD